MSNYSQRVKVLFITTKDAGKSIVGIYTDDKEGNKILTIVHRNLKRKHPNLPIHVYEFMLNIPNV